MSAAAAQVSARPRAKRRHAGTEAVYGCSTSAMVRAACGDEGVAVANADTTIRIQAGFIWSVADLLRGDYKQRGRSLGWPLNGRPWWSPSPRS